MKLTAEFKPSKIETEVTAQTNTRRQAQHLRSICDILRKRQVVTITPFHFGGLIFTVLIIRMMPMII